MSEPIDRKTVESVASLARIDLPEAQIDETAGKLQDVLTYIGQLEQVELPEDVEPFFGAIESVNAVRADQQGNSVERDLILSNAPDADGEFYRVPPVL